MSSKPIRTAFVREAAEALLLLTVGTAIWGDETDDVIPTVQKAWNEREASVNTLVCEWTADRIDGAETIGVTESDNRASWWPKTDATTNHRCRFLIGINGKMRCDDDGPHFTYQTRTYEPRSRISVMNGERIRSFISGDQTADEKLRFHPFGMIFKEPRISDLQSIDLLPLLLMFRPSTPEVLEGTVNLSQFEYRGTANINGAECIHLEKINGTTVTSLFVDPARGHVPIRCRNSGRDATTDGEMHVYNQMDVDYAKDESDRWLPATWKHAILRSNGKVIQQAEATVTKIELNVAIPDELFEFEFPGGTVVNDAKAGEHYIFREGGGKRHITFAEQRAPYERLLATESGQAVELTSPRKRWGRWIVLANIAVICMMVVIWLFRSRRGKARLGRV